MINMNQEYNANAWGHESILSFFEKNRLTKNDIYPSEWFFLDKKIVNGINILDIGCAKGGMANILSECVQDFSYVGVDINAHMIESAKKKYPQHLFYQINEDDYSILGDTQYDLVICLGILHLHESWRHTIKVAWQHTQGSLILDLRETYHASIENKALAYFKMDFTNTNSITPNYFLPYNIINSTESLRTIHEICSDASKISYYGYTQAVSELAVSPIKKLMATVYCIER